METPPTEDALLGGRVRLLQPARGYRVAVDAVLLAASIEAGPQDRVLDLGAGVGSVGLCVATRVPGCTVVGVELQPAMAALAERNAALNRLSGRVRTIVHDLAQPLPADLGLFEQVVTNPPYLAATVADPSPDPAKALATVESSATLERWLAVSATALKPAGTLTIIQRTDRLEEIVGHLERLGLGEIVTKRLPPAARVLIRARRSARPSRREAAPLVLHPPDGGYTEAAETVLRHAASLAF
ncbi:MAG: methyltransferase [Proteobacteria bacterium]|nr:methyltransferase [Pseudomonadota bacterium]